MGLRYKKNWLFPLAFCLLAVMVSSNAGLAKRKKRAPDGRRGVRARIVVSSELMEARNWPVREERGDALQGVHRIRRPHGPAGITPMEEPRLPLRVVLEGARAKSPSRQRISVDGMRFVPAEVVITKGTELEITNRETRFITIDREKGGELAIIEKGKSEQAKLPKGEHILKLRSFPFAKAKVKVLPEATFLEWDEEGEVDLLDVKPGKYQLAFYLGAHALRVQEIEVPEEGVIAIDATVSANGVVTVSLKDGDLQVPVRPD